MDIDPYADEWNDLATLLGAYLHQDFQEDYGSPAETVHTFCQQARPETRKNAADQVRRILDGTDDEAGTERVIDTFGTSYAPEFDGLTWRAWLTELEATLRWPGATPNERLGHP